MPETLHIRQRIENLDNFPTMPATGRKLLALQEDPAASINDLAKIISTDPIVSAQIVRYVQTPLFRFRQKTTSIKDAVMLLGYDKCLQMALGFTGGQCFDIPDKGPIGLTAYWRHAVYSATLNQILAQNMPAELGADPGFAYLAGLTHNIGLVAMGHMCPKEFDILNILLERPETPPLPELEKQRLDTTHMEIGVWLLRRWGLPAEIVVAAAEHHNEAYRGQHHVYANLTLISDRCLLSHDIGDAETEAFPLPLIKRLSLTTEHLYQGLDQVMANQKELDELVKTFDKKKKR